MAAVSVAGLILGVPAGAAETPTVALGSAAGSPGDAVLVTGTSWQPGTIVVLEVCGNEALDGAADCAAASAANVGVQPNGTFSTLITVAEPPSPCPCVLQVTSTSEVTELRVPFEVVGAPVAPPLARATVPGIQRALEVRRAVLEGSGWRGWLGLGARRTLVVEVENVGDVQLRGVPLTVSAGRGDDPTGHVDAPDVGDLAPGERRVVRVPIEFDALEFGELRVVGSMNGIGEPVRFATQTSNPPVLPLLLLALVVQWVLLRGRNWLRRRIHDREAVDEDDDRLPPGAAPGSIETETVVIDLNASPTPVAAGGHQAEDAASSTGASAPSLVDTEAREGLRAAIEHSQSLVDESTARSEELEVRLADRLRTAAARNATSIGLLEQAKQRADEIIAAADAAASVALHAAEAERAAARQEREEAHGVRVQSVANAWAVLEAFIQEHGPKPQHESAPAVAVPVSPAAGAPRLGSVEQSIARAVSRAVAATMADRTLVD